MITLQKEEMMGAKRKAKYMRRNLVFAETLRRFDIRQSEICAKTKELQSRGIGKAVEEATFSRFLSETHNKNVSIDALDALESALRIVGGETAYFYYSTRIEESLEAAHRTCLATCAA
ncbi:MAG: hypothetical protein HC781_21685 [Leptolyngbyaceae cyanobacterium CSU_1_4]|nr:hypothetical protein [Leptolyngbyaceae cyanobacterium CSU_1_4]